MTDNKTNRLMLQAQIVAVERVLEIMPTLKNNVYTESIQAYIDSLKHDLRMIPNDNYLEYPPPRPNAPTISMQVKSSDDYPNFKDEMKKIQKKLKKLKRQYE